MPSEKQSPVAAKRVVIGERQFQIRPWSPDDGDRWWFLLLQAGLGAMTAVGPKRSDQLIAMMRSVDDHTFMAFRDVCFRYTDIVGSDRGEETILPLAEHRGAMRHRFVDLLRLMNEHLELMFSSPFSELVALIPAQAAEETES